MKRRLIPTIAIIAASVITGYFFVISALLGFLLTRCLASKTAGGKGRIKSVIVPFGKWQVHFHHWIISSWVIVIGLATNVHFFTPVVFCGFFSGLVFHGIFCYSDWHRIIIHRHRYETHKKLPFSAATGTSVNPTKASLLRGPRRAVSPASWGA